MNDDLNPPQDITAAPVPADPRPWPRYFARMIDVLLFGMVGMLVLGIVLALATDMSEASMLAATAGLGGMLLSNVLMFLLALLPIACLIAFAQTPGKWLFGIRVRNADGSRMRLWTSLKREAWVVVRGIGLGLPLVTLFTQISSFTDLKEEGITAWDRKLGCQVQHAPATWFWWVRATFGGALVLAVTVWGYIDYIRSMVGG